MGKATRRKQLDEQKQKFFSTNGDGRSAEDRANARAMLEALQQKLEDDALREDGFCFINGKYNDSRRTRLTSGMKTRSFDRHTRKVMAAKIVLIPAIQLTATKKEDMLLFTFGLDSVSIWNMNTGAIMASLDVTPLHAQCICGGAALLPVLLKASSDRSICFAYATHHMPVVHRFSLLANAITPAEVLTDKFDLASSFCTGHQQLISCMEFSHDGSMLATGSWDSTCMLWKISPGYEPESFQHPKATEALPHEEKVLILTLLRVLPVHNEGSSCLAFTCGDQALVTCGECTVKVWDVSTVFSTVQGNASNQNGDVNQLAFEKRLREWEEAIPFSFSIEHSMNLLAFDETLTPLIANHEWHHTRHEAEPHTLLTPVQSEQERYNLVDVRLCLDAIVASVERKNSDISGFDEDRRDDDNCLANQFVETIDVSGAAESPEIDDSGPMLTPVRRAQLKAQYQSMENFDFKTLFTPGLSLCSADDGNPASIQAKTLTRRSDHPDAIKWLIREFGKTTSDGTFSSHTSTITDCAVAQELDLVVTVAFDKSVRYWSLEQGVIVETIRDAHDAPITCCALTSPTTCDLGVHDMLLATGGSDNLVKVWRRNAPQKAECVFSLAGHYDTIASTIFDPHGIFLVSTSEDTTAILWRIRPSSPEQPEVPKITSIDRFAIGISWDEPLANGAKILHYIVRTTQVSSFAGDGSDLRHVPDTKVQAKYLTKTVEKLQPGVKYIFQVAAVNEIGSSPFSDTTELAETLAFVPSKIDGSVEYTDREATRIRLSWTPPCPNGAMILSYTIQCRPENSAFVPLREICVRVENLQQPHDSSTKIDVPEQGSHGVKRGAAAVRGRVKVGSRTTKAKIRSRAKMGDASMSKIPLSEAAGQDILTQPAIAFSSPSPPPNIMAQLSYTVDDLWAGEVYQFVVAASNRCGLGEFSRVSDYVKMDCMAPDQPLKPDIVEVGKRQVNVQWVAPRCNGSAILQYTVRWHQDVDESSDKANGGAKSLALLTRSLNGTCYTLQGLEPGGDVQVWVSASNLVDNKLLQSVESAGSNIARTLCDVPDTPDTPTLHYPSTHTLSLRFTAPRGNGLPIDGYVVALYSEETQFGVLVRELVREFALAPHELAFHLNRENSPNIRPNAEYTLQHLRGGTFYSITLCARNTLGFGAASAASVPTQTLPATVPAVVEQAPVVTEVTPTSALIHWSAPNHDGGAPLHGFHLEYCVQASPTAPRLDEKMEQGGELRVSRGQELNATFLRPHRVYRFRVAPENAVGRAAPSSWSLAFVTPSLVDYTITRYFANRPEEENEAARVVQRAYHVWRQAAADRTRFTEALVHALEHWHIL